MTEAKFSRYQKTIIAARIETREAWNLLEFTPWYRPFLRKERERLARQAEEREADLERKGWNL